MEDAKIVCRDGSTMSVPVLAERGVWCVHLTPAGPGRGPSCSLTHRPSGASIVEVFSRTAALHALSFLNPDYQPAAIGPSDGVRFRMPKGSAPGGLLEMLAWLADDGVLHVGGHEDLGDALDRVGIVDTEVG